MGSDICRLVARRRRHLYRTRDRECAAPSLSFFFRTSEQPRLASARIRTSRTALCQQSIATPLDQRAWRTLRVFPTLWLPFATPLTSRPALFIAGVEFIDDRIEFPSWPARKPTTPYGALPVLEWEGKQLAQSNAIMRFIGRKYDLYVHGTSALAW